MRPSSRVLLSPSWVATLAHRQRPGEPRVLVSHGKPIVCLDFGRAGRGVASVRLRGFSGWVLARAAGRPARGRRP
jgi:hypothetical protein